MSEPSWMQEARKMDGLKEVVGSAHEPRIVEFFAEAGAPWVKDDETAWCAAFANAMLSRAGYKGTGKLNARSFLDWGLPVDEHDVRPGDLVVLERGSSWQGHVTFFVDGTAKTLRGLGGNQANAVGIATFQRSKVLGYRRPNERIATKAPERAQNDLLRVGAMNSPRVRAMQLQLKELGYAIGNADGDFGNLTRDAVLAWKADNGLPLSADVSPGDLERMETSAARPLGAGRITATASEVKQVDESVRHDDKAMKTIAVTAATVGGPVLADQGGLLDGLKTTSEATAQAKGIFDQVVSATKDLGVDLAAFVSDHSVLLLSLGLLVAAVFIFKSMRARIDDHRNGKRL